MKLITILYCMFPVVAVIYCMFACFYITLHDDIYKRHKLTKRKQLQLKRNIQKVNKKTK